MNVELDPTLGRLVDDLLAWGRYESREQVLGAALQLLKEQEQWDRDNADRLRQELAVGLEQSARGDVEPLDMDAIKAKVHDQHSAQHGKAG